MVKVQVSFIELAEQEGCPPEGHGYLSKTELREGSYRLGACARLS
jgi:hypothetical protein